MCASKYFTACAIALALFVLLLVETAGAEETRLCGHMEEFGRSGEIVPVTLTDGFPTLKTFMLNHVMPGQPLLMKGAAKTYPAYAKWTDDYLRRNIPEPPYGNVAVEYQKKENRKTGGIMHFSRFMDLYNDTDIYLVDNVLDWLRNDVYLPPPMSCAILRAIFDKALMWFSSGGTRSVLHNDSYENINCLIRGNKTIYMLKDSEELSKFLLDNEPKGYSYVDVARVDLHKYPLLRNAKMYRVDMEQGDCVYIPFNILHQVASYGSNLAVNFWFNKALYELMNKNSPPPSCPSEPEVSPKQLTDASIVQFAFGQTCIQLWPRARKTVLQMTDFINVVMHKPMQPTEVGLTGNAALEEVFSFLDLDADGVITQNEVCYSKLKDVKILQATHTIVQALATWNSAANAGYGLHLADHKMSFEWKAWGIDSNAGSIKRQTGQSVS